MAELIEDHIKEHVAHPDVSAQEHEDAVEELVAVVRTCLK